MIDLHFHWAWLLIAAFVITGIYSYWYFAHDDGGMGAGIRTFFGFMLLIGCILAGLAIGGIFIW